MVAESNGGADDAAARRKRRGLRTKNRNIRRNRTDQKATLWGRPHIREIVGSLWAFPVYSCPISSCHWCVSCSLPFFPFRRWKQLMFRSQSGKLKPKMTQSFCACKRESVRVCLSDTL